MVKFCCVPFCRSRKTKDSKLLFHSFPVAKSLREQWLHVVQQHIRKSPRHSNPFVIKDHTKVCSRHFLKTDYWQAGNVLKLRKNAVPTIFNIPKDKNKIVSSAVDNNEENQVIVLKEDTQDHVVKTNKKPAPIKIDVEKTKASSVKKINLKNTKMIQNCRNLLLINKDHAYAALWPNKPTENTKSNSSEDDTDNDETDKPSITEGIVNNNLNVQEKVTIPIEISVEESENISLDKNNADNCNNIVIQNNTDIQQSIESIYVKEEVIEEFSQDAKETNISKSIVSNISTENDSLICSQTVEQKRGSTVATPNVQNKNIGNANNTLHTKPSKRINTVSKTILPEICILCATANMSRKNYTLIVHFAEMIMDLSGVEILKSNVAPIACNVCFKNVLEMWNFKQQIIAADKFIREKIPKQPPIHTNSGNVPTPTTTFEYIDCNKRNLNNIIVNHDCESHIQLDNIDHSNQEIPQKNNKLPTSNQNKSNESKDLPKLKNDLHKKNNGVTLVPIENILKDNSTTVGDNDSYNDIDSESSEDCLDLPTCTDCGNIFTNITTRNCRCDRVIKKKDQVPEKFVCSMCGKQYPLLRSLRRHEITHKTKKYLCTVCGEVFHFRLYLKRHMRKHSGKKPFVCPYCNKKFSSQWNLSQHKRLHTNSLPYECRLCPTAFRHNVTLKKHVRLFHTADEFTRNSSSANPVDSKS